MSIMLPVYEEMGETLHSHGEHEFGINPARHDIVQVAVDGKFIGMRVERIEHRVTEAFLVPLERRVFNTIVVVRRTAGNEVQK